MNFDFEPDFQKKILYIRLKQPFRLSTPNEWQSLKTSWCHALKMWHTPYKACIDLSHMNVTSEDPKLMKPLFRMIDFFNGFYLKKAVIFGFKYSGELPLKNLSSVDEALIELGVRVKGSFKRSSHDDFRSLIQIENHMSDQIVELSFADQVSLNSHSQINVLRSKLTNNLMHWHQSWCLLIDSSLITEIHPHTLKPLIQMIQFFKGFYMSAALSYGNSSLTKAIQAELAEYITFTRTKHLALRGLKNTRLSDKSQPHKLDKPSCASRPSSS